MYTPTKERALSNEDHERRHDEPAIARILRESPDVRLLYRCIGTTTMAIEAERRAALMALQAHDEDKAARHFIAMASEEVSLRRYCSALARVLTPAMWGLTPVR